MGGVAPPVISIVYGLRIQLFLNQSLKYNTSETMYETSTFSLKLLNVLLKQLA